MIIERMHMDGFGIYHDFNLDQLKPGLNIFLGDNEAGKSTLQKFISYTLFGYPHKIQDRLAPLNGGEHGGRIFAKLQDGRQAVYYRNGKGKTQLEINSQSYADQTSWFKSLGDVSPEMFQNVYSFGIDELIDLAKLEESGVKDKLFSVSMGLGSLTVGSVESKLLEEMQAIYKSRGSTQKVPLLIHVIKEKQQEIQKTQAALPRYNQLSEEISKLEEELLSVDNEIKTLQSERQKFDNAQRCYSSFVDLTEGEKAIKELPGSFGYPADSLEKLEKLLLEKEKIQTLARDIREGTEDEKGLNELEKEASGLEFHGELVSSTGSIEFLRDNLKVYSKTLKDLEGEEQELLKREAVLKESISQISSQWSRSSILEFREELNYRDKVESFSEQFTTLEKEKYGEQQLLQAAKTSKASSLNIKSLAVIVSILFLAGAGTFLYFSHILPAVLLALSAAISFFGRKALIKGAEESKGKGTNLLAEKESHLKDEYTSLLKEELQLPENLRPESVILILDKIPGLKTEIRSIETIRNKINTEYKPFLEEFEKIAGDLAQLVGMKSENNTVEILTRDLLHRYTKEKESETRKKELENQVLKKQARLERGQKVAEENQLQLEALLKEYGTKDEKEFREKYDSDRKLDRAKDNIKNAEQQIQTIAGIGKLQELRAFMEKNDPGDLKLEITRLDEALSAAEENKKNISYKLGENNKEKENLEGSSELELKLTELETLQSQLRDYSKSWLQAKLALNMLREVKEKYEVEKQPEIILRAAKYFESITEGKYKHIRASLEGDELGIIDSKGRIKDINKGELSRGTREQLLISLRLGFIAEYQKNREALPLVLDEILVNSDPARARQSAKLISEFARETQIFLFTCHPGTVDYFDGKGHVIKLS